MFNKISYRGIFILASLLFFAACSNLDGRIEIREKNRIFLVNNSKEKEYKFTIKKTTTTNDSLFDYSTEFIQLAPGDEKNLGFLQDVSLPEFSIIDEKTLVFFIPPKIDMTILGKVIQFKKDTIIKLPDTIIGNEVLKRYYNYDPIGLFYLGSQNIEGVFDTTIDGNKLKYRYFIKKVIDSIHPLPAKHYKYKFEVTGQISISQSTKAKSK